MNENQEQEQDQEPDPDQPQDRGEDQDQATLGDAQLQGETPEARAESAQQRTRELADELERVQATESGSQTDAEAHAAEE